MNTELMGIFWASFVLALSGALMPGPLLTVTISESVKKGAWVGPAVILGHGILELGLVVLIFTGLGPYLKANGVAGSISLMGGAVLLWMGWSMFAEAPRLSLEETSRDETSGKGIHGPVAYGILMSVSNPYWTLWWVTIGLGYMMSAMKFGVIGIGAFFTGHISADLAWYSLVSLVMSKGRTFLSDRAYQAIVRTCAACLVLFGVWFLYTAYNHLMTA